jgi:predicted CopG family antitoxin
MADNTTVVIRKETRGILAELKQHPRESWEEVIRRLAEREKAAKEAAADAQTGKGRRSA